MEIQSLKGLLPLFGEVVGGQPQQDVVDGPFRSQLGRDVGTCGGGIGLGRGHPILRQARVQATVIVFGGGGDGGIVAAVPKGARCSVGVHIGKIEAWDANAFPIRVTSAGNISGGHATLRGIGGGHASIVGLGLRRRLRGGWWRGWYLKGGGRGLGMQFRIVGDMLGIRRRWRWYGIS